MVVFPAKEGVMAVRGQAETRIKVGAAGAAGLLLFLALVRTSPHTNYQKLYLYLYLKIQIQFLYLQIQIQFLQGKVGAAGLLLVLALACTQPTHLIFCSN